MNRYEEKQELRRRKEDLEQKIDRCYTILEGMAEDGHKHGINYSVSRFVQISSELHAAQCRLQAVKARLNRLKNGNPGSYLPVMEPVSIIQLQNQIRR
ncbi:MAG TPA: hypothetical protein VLH56_16830 [Dissulfurispiraceae bacterium]|nr:hypothetical protein [Dissulfurispiraceae bacterium]